MELGMKKSEIGESPSLPQETQMLYLKYAMRHTPILGRGEGLLERISISVRIEINKKRYEN